MAGRPPPRTRRTRRRVRCRHEEPEHLGRQQRLITSVPRSSLATSRPGAGGLGAVPRVPSPTCPARTASRRESSRVSQVLGVPQPQVGERTLPGPTAGDVHPQLGEPEEPGDERLDDVDALQPVDPDAAGLPGDDAGVDAELVALDPVLRAQPRRRAVAPRRRPAAPAASSRSAPSRPEEVVPGRAEHHHDER